MRLLLTLLLAPASAPPPPAPPPVTQPAVQRLQVDLAGFADDPVLAALRLRLQGREILRHADATATPDLYLRVERTGDTTATMQAITADGRAYDRSFTIEVGQEVRSVATTAVNLLFAIQQGTVVPDQQGVAIPEPPPPEPEPPPPSPEPLEPHPEPSATNPEPPKPSPPNPGLAPPRKTTLALVTHAAATLGLGPPQQPPLAAAGAGLGLELRAPSGLAASFELRAAGLRRADLGLARLRVAVGLGYALRRDRFELPVLLVLAVEPWWPLQSGSATTLQSDGATTRGSPLLSAHLRLSPGVRLTPARGPALRLGPRLELGGGFVLDDGPRVVSLDDPTGTPRARLGGLELSLGLELAVQFSLPR